MELLDNKYLFNLSMLNNYMPMMEYIYNVVQYEKKFNCHIDNKQFHRCPLLLELF